MSTGSIVSSGSVVTVWYLWVQWYLLVHGQWVHIISSLKDIYCMYRSNTYVYLLVRWRARGPRGHGKCKGPMCARARVWPERPRVWSEGGGVIVARIPSRLERESGVVGENILTFGVREEWVWVWVWVWAWAAWPRGCERDKNRTYLEGTHNSVLCDAVIPSSSLAFGARIRLGSREGVGNGDTPGRKLPPTRVWGEGEGGR